MTIKAGKKVSFEYTLTLSGDDTIISSNAGDEPLAYEHGADQIISGLEKGMEGMTIGESRQITIAPKDGYGEIDKKSVIELDKNEIPKESRKLGGRIQAKNPSGQLVWGRVVEMKKNKVLLNFNHPLAGQTLLYEVTILDIS